MFQGFKSVMPALAGMTIKTSLLFCIFSSAVFACGVVDDTGQVIHLNAPAKRIISLSPDLTEILFAVHADHQIVGVMNGSDYPDAAKKIPVIGSYTGIDIERVLSLHPDLIVTWGAMFSHQLAVFKKMGIPIYISDPHQLSDVAKTIKHLGCLTGNEKMAEQQAEEFSKQLQTLQQRYQRHKPIKVFYQIGSHPLLTINKASWINQAIKLCGGENVFADLKFAAPEVNIESVIAANPDVILADAKDEQWKQAWLPWSQVTAVKNQALYNINPDWIDRPGPRLIWGVRQVCEKLAPSS